MALLWVDGFDWITPNTTNPQFSAALGKRYPYRNTSTGNDALSLADVFGLGTALVFRHGGQYIETPALVPSEAEETWITGFRVRGFNALVGSDQTLMYFLNSQRENAGQLYIKNTGHLRYSNAAPPYSPRLVPNNYWSFYLEIKLYVHDTLGTLEIRVNGEQFWLVENFDTRISSPAGIDRLRFCGWSNTGTGDGIGVYIDDIYICQGTSIDFLGPMRIPHLVPDGDGDDEQWELSSGSDSYVLVDEDEPVDGDSEYIYDGTTGQRTLFTYENVPTGLGSNIKGVLLSTGSRVDNGALDLKQQVKSGGTLYPRDAQNISSGSFIQIRDLMETDPDTALAWTEAGLNAAQFGVEVG